MYRRHCELNFAFSFKHDVLVSIRRALARRPVMLGEISHSEFALVTVLMVTRFPVWLGAG